jgi:hypothetical protein
MEGVMKMFRKCLVTILPVFILVFAYTFAGDTAYGEYARQDRYLSRDDRMISQERDGRDIDDWIERGESSVTESPEFKDGIRLAARANRRRDDDYALASAVYFFQIPEMARLIKIEIHYKGDSGRDEFNENLAGRVWIRSTEGSEGRGRGRLGEERFRDDDQAMHGDTFDLREGKRREEIEISARDHTFDGVMELHVIAEGRQTIDVKRIEVRTSRHSPDVRVVTREHRESIPESRNKSVYQYFYKGSVHRFGDRHYVRHVYPRRRYVEVRRQYRSRILRHRTRRPHFRIYWSIRPRYMRHIYRKRHGIHLRKWTPFYAEIGW